MIRVILNGYTGNMCQVLLSEINKYNDMIVTAGIDSKLSEIMQFKNKDVPLYSNPYDIQEEADVIIDFSHPSCIKEIVAYASYKKIPLVIATTGISTSLNNKINEASKSIPIFISANMSIGINLLLKLINESARLLNDSFDIEIIEKHHNNKVDAPSGTAYLIADNINKTLNNSKNLVFLRHGNQSKRSSCEIGVHSIRCGTIVGEHSVIFAGNDEILEIKHTALSKKIFAVGALNAARFIINKEPNIYNMNNMINK